VIALSLCALIFSSHAVSQNSDIIQDIRIEGLQRVKDSTIFESLKLEIGDSFNQDSASKTIRELYQTGFFQKVDIVFEKNNVFIKVVENDSIASISFAGNKAFKDEVLRNVLKDNGIVEGNVYRPQTADKFIKQLKRQYLNEGKYAAKVELQAINFQSSRVALKILINEGETAAIKKITIIGNEHFSNKKILSSFRSKTSKGLNPFSKRNRYSKSKLTADIGKLSSLYQNDGFADFKIASSRVSINPEKDGVFLTLSLDEGVRYKVKQFSLNGRLVVGEEELLPLVTIRPQEYYSRSDVQNTVQNILDRLSNEGFSNARVVPVPSFDSDKAEVSFSINVNPEKTVFVRRIDLFGNDKTTDEVIRRELVQVEGAPLSTGMVQDSTRRLRRLIYIENAEIEVKLVPEDENLVDLVVRITETSSARVSFGAGYSGDDGVILQAEYVENNFRGKGESIDFKVDTTESNKTLRFNYTKPYLTPSGISRTVGLNFNRRDTEEDDTSAYLLDSLAFNVSYRFPLSSSTFFTLGGALESIDLESTDATAPEIKTFIDENPSSDLFRINSRLSFDTRDNLLAPNSGWNNFVNLELSIPGSDIEYYKVDLNSTYYLPLTERFTFKLSGRLGVGDGFGDTSTLPFFRNYFAGGASTVRGFNSRSLGPRDTTVDEDPLGGSKSLLLNASFLTPVPGVDTNSSRLGIFVDAGQVFSEDQSIELSELRASVGVSLNWLTPLGPLAISYATPIKDEEGDDLDRVQFSIGRFLD
jgi:outer membrane protein insertion porin family